MLQYKLGTVGGDEINEKSRKNKENILIENKKFFLKIFIT
jgi:hypothetical protein